MVERKLSRRRLFQYATVPLLAWPLRRLIFETQASAAEDPLCVILAYIPAGIDAKQWFPQGTDTGFTLPYVSQPLEALRNDLLIFSNLDTVGQDNHQGGPRQVFSGGGNDGSPIYSLDQRLADLWQGQTPFPSVALGVGTRQSRDAIAVSFKNGGIGVPAIDDPKVSYNELFGNFRSSSNTASVAAEQQAQIANGSKRVLDFAREDFKRIKSLLGNEEKAIYDAHVSAIDDLGREAQNIPNTQPSATCSPKVVEPMLGTLKITNAYYPEWYHEKVNVEPIVKINRALMVQALACRLTRVGLLQFGESNSQLVMHFNGLKDHQTMHHNLSHNNDQNFHDVQRKFVEEVVAFAQELKGVNLASGKNLFQTSLIFTSSCIGSNPNNHDGKNIPCFTLGNANGALRTGRFINNPAGTMYNELLVAIAKTCGLDTAKGIGNATITKALSGFA